MDHTTSFCLSNAFPVYCIKALFRGAPPSSGSFLQQYYSIARRSPKYAAAPFPSSFLLEPETFVFLPQCATVQTVSHSALGAKARALRAAPDGA